MYSLNKLSNEELVSMLKEDFSTIYFENLLQRFMNLVYKYRYKFVIDYFELDDYIQEARIVLYQSIVHYDFNKPYYFASFFHRNLRYHYINIWRYKFAKKRGNGLNLVYLNDEFGNDEQQLELIDMIHDGYHVSHDNILEVKEKTTSYFSKLSPLEKEVFQFYLEGEDLEEIASLCQLSLSQVRNAIDRCRKKMRHHFDL